MRLLGPLPERCTENRCGGLRLETAGGGNNMLVHRTHNTNGCLKISSFLPEASSEDPLIPSKLIDLSCLSMETIEDSSIIPRETSLINFSLNDELDDEPFVFLNPEKAFYTPQKLEPIEDDVKVAAVDVSSIKIGETDNGAIYAIRGAVAWKLHENYFYIRCGPLTYHLTPQTRPSISRMLGFQNTANQSFSTTLDIHILVRLRNILERWMQKFICSTFRDSIVLFDGSLTAGTPDIPVSQLKVILDAAKENGNIVLAFSKKTKLCFEGHRITDLAEKMHPPSLLNVDHLVSKQFTAPQIHLLGRIYVSKLAQHGFVFRMDADREVPEECCFLAVRRLIGSDLVENGYPETLRLAHVLSTFTANEIIGIQGFMAGTYCAQIAHKPSLRRTLFGPFGTSKEVF